MVWGANFLVILSVLAATCPRSTLPMFYNLLHCEWYLPLETGPKPHPDFSYFRLFPWDVFEWQASVPSHRAWEDCVLRCWDVSVSVTHRIWRRYGCFLQNSGWGANHSLSETGPPGLWCHVKPKGPRASVFILLGPVPSHGTNLNCCKIAFLRVLSFLGKDF